MPYWCANLKEIDAQEGCLCLAQSYFCKMVQRRKCEENGAILGTHLAHYWADSLQIWYVESHTYMEGIKHVNLIEICPVVIEI